MPTNATATIEKQANPVMLDKDGNPIAIIYFSKDRKRIIYTLSEASEEDIIALIAPVQMVSEF